jgi:hypothetical protein
MRGSGQSESQEEVESESPEEVESESPEEVESESPEEVESELPEVESESPFVVSNPVSVPVVESSVVLESPFIPASPEVVSSAAGWQKPSTELQRRPSQHARSSMHQRVRSSRGTQVLTHSAGPRVAVPGS